MSVTERETEVVPHPCMVPGPHPLHDPLGVSVVLGVAVSAALHGRMALSGAHGPFWSVVMAGMALVCGLCLVALLRRGRSATEAGTTMTMTMGMALAMALAHALMLPFAGEMSGHHASAHHHGMATGPTGSAAPGAGHGSMLVVVAVELLIAALAVTWTRRHARDQVRRG